MMPWQRVWAVRRGGGGINSGCVGGERRARRRAVTAGLSVRCAVAAVRRAVSHFTSSYGVDPDLHAAGYEQE